MHANKTRKCCFLWRECYPSCTTAAPLSLDIVSKTDIILRNKLEVNRIRNKCFGWFSFHFMSLLADHKVQWLFVLPSVTYPGYKLDGGVPQDDIREEEACRLACVGSCQAAEYNRDTKRCLHHYEETACRPGRITPDLRSWIHFRKRHCGMYASDIEVKLIPLCRGNWIFSRFCFQNATHCSSVGQTVFQMNRSLLEGRRMVSLDLDLVFVWMWSTPSSKLSQLPLQRKFSAARRSSLLLSGYRWVPINPNMDNPNSWLIRRSYWDCTSINLCNANLLS